jgi:hypothetical protein
MDIFLLIFQPSEFLSIYTIVFTRVFTCFRPRFSVLSRERYGRGLAIMLFVFTGLGYMIRSATVAALSILDDSMVKLQNGTTDLHKISGVVGSKMSVTDPYHDIVFYLIICFWIFAIIDAYIIGKEKESQDEES